MDLRNSTLVRGPSPRKIPVAAIGTHCLPASQLKRACFPIVCPHLLYGARLYPCIWGPQRPPCGTTEVCLLWTGSWFPWIPVQCPSLSSGTISAHGGVSEDRGRGSWDASLFLFLLPTLFPILNSLHYFSALLHPSLEASSISHTPHK